jgi:hypothetical protein
MISKMRAPASPGCRRSTELPHPYTALAARLVPYTAFQIAPEVAERVLRHAALKMWLSAECETAADSVSFATIVDHYLPFFPLTVEDVSTGRE